MRGFPEKPMLDIAEGLKLLEKINPVYEPKDGKVPFCYPGTTLRWDDQIIQLAARILTQQHNLIGIHTLGGGEASISAEGGFESIQKLEAEAIWMLADMVGGNSRSVDGYFCGGATEANIQGLWVGRQWLREHPDPVNRGICILCTPLTHYSIFKASSLLDIGHSGQSNCPQCSIDHVFVPDAKGSGVALVGMDDQGRMSLSELERVFKLKHDEGFRRFLIVATVGTTAMGSTDPIEEIAHYIKDVHRKTLAHCYLHVDAAFGGFTVPFVNPERKIGFDLPEVMSMSFDADKMGRLPYPSGVHLVRKNLSRVVGRRVTYIGGSQDATLSGSRTGLAGLMAYFLFVTGGKEAQRKYAQDCINARNRLAELITERLTWARIVTIPPEVNMLPVEFRMKDGKIPLSIEKGDILDGYHLRSDHFQSKPNDTQSCPRIVYKLCVMPHTFPFLESFVSDLQKAYDTMGTEDT